MSKYRLACLHVALAHKLLRVLGPSLVWGLFSAHVSLEADKVLQNQYVTNLYIFKAVGLTV